MVTQKSYFDDAGTYQTAEVYFGLSTDTKPTTVANGSCYLEMDSSKIYFFDAAGSAGEQWILWGSTPEDAGAE